MHHTPVSARRLTFVAVALVDRRRAARQEKALLFQVSSRFAYTIRRLHTLVLPVVSILFVNTWQPRQRPRVARDRHRYHQRRARTPKARQRNAQGPNSFPSLPPESDCEDTSHLGCCSGHVCFSHSEYIHTPFLTLSLVCRYEFNAITDRDVRPHAPIIPPSLLIDRCAGGCCIWQACLHIILGQCGNAGFHPTVLEVGQ